MPVNVQFHEFSDASGHAYAAVVYVRYCYEDGRIDVRIVAARTKVAPLIKQSIPRLELLGALLLARLQDQLRSDKHEFSTVCWTDSTTLCWVKNGRAWKQYVQHRVDEIRELTTKDV